MTVNRSQYSLIKYQQKNKKRKFFIKPKICLGICLVICLLICLFFYREPLFNQQLLIQNLTEKHPCCTEIIFLSLFTILTILGIPGTILVFVGGSIFGLTWGTFWSVLGATMGALGAFLIARYFLHDSIAKKYSKHKALKKLQTYIKREPFYFILAVRFAPISPFNLVNFLLALTPINWFTYTLATFIGIIPGTLAYTWLGISGMKLLAGENNLSFFLALVFLSLLSCVPLLVKKSRKPSQN